MAGLTPTTNYVVTNNTDPKTVVVNKFRIPYGSSITLQFLDMDFINALTDGLITIVPSPLLPAENSQLLINLTGGSNSTTIGPILTWNDVNDSVSSYAVQMTNMYYDMSGNLQVLNSIQNQIWSIQKRLRG